MDDDLELVRRGYFNDLLAEVVTELISHRIRKCELHSFNQSRYEVRRQTLLVLKLLLDHAAPSLIVSK